MVDLNGHEAGNGDTAKEYLQPIGTPLLGERGCYNRNRMAETITPADPSPFYRLESRSRHKTME